MVFVDEIECLMGKCRKRRKTAAEASFKCKHGIIAEFGLVSDDKTDGDGAEDIDGKSPKREGYGERVWEKAYGVTRSGTAGTAEGDSHKFQKKREHISSESVS